MSAPNHRTCARCGALNPINATVCGRCGQALPRQEDAGRLWSTDGNDPASQVTAPFQQPRAYLPESRSYETTTGPRSNADTFVRAPVVSYSPAAAKTRRGPHGCILGGLAVLVILAVAGVLAWTVTKPLVSDRISDELNKGIATQVAQIESPRLQSAGELTITEDEINTEIEQYRASYDPVKNVRVRITRGEVRVNFDLYGSTSTLRGSLAVENGEIVVVNSSLSGVAGQVLEKDDIISVFEAQLASLMTLSNVEPTAVEMNDGSLSITTRRAGR